MPVHKKTQRQKQIRGELGWICSVKVVVDISSLSRRRTPQICSKFCHAVTRVIVVNDSMDSTGAVARQWSET